MGKKIVKKKPQLQVSQALIIPDCHFPFSDRTAYELMLDVAKDLDNLQEIVLLGDYADFYNVNFHGKDPEIEGTLVDEVDSVNQELDRLDALWPEQKKVYLMGNHEYRLDRYINKQAPDLWGAITVPQLFQLRKRPNWRIIPYGPDQIYYVGGSQLAARHEPMGSGTHSAYQTVVKAGTSVVFGQIHQIQEFQVVMISGKNHRGISVGWLGDKSSKVMNYVKHHHQWSLGFGVANILPDGSFFHHTVHIIPDLKDKRVYRCSYGGKIYERGV